MKTQKRRFVNSARNDKMVTQKMKQHDFFQDSNGTRYFTSRLNKTADIRGRIAANRKG